MEPAIRVTSGKASRRRGNSLRLPGAEMNGAITLQFRSQKATTLSPLIFLCPLKPILSPPLFRRCGRAVAVDDRDVKELRLMERQHQALEDRIETAIRHPTAKRPPDTDVVDLQAPGRVLFDGQFLPLATEVQSFQYVIEAGMKGQFSRWPAPSNGQVRQDKFLELLKAEFVGNSRQHARFAIFAPQKGERVKNQTFKSRIQRFQHPTGGSDLAENPQRVVRMPSPTYRATNPS